MSVEVIVKRRRSPVAQPKSTPKPERMDLAEVIDRVTRLSDMARRITGASRVNPEQFSMDKDELVRAIGRLEADLRRRGVR